MTQSRSDRPYGQFPRGDVTEPAPTPEPPQRLPLRERVARRLRAPLAFLSLVALTWFLVSAVQTGGLVALRAEQEQPTPEPTPLLSVAVYQHVAPSVVQVVARRPDGEVPNTGAGVIVDEMADILTSLHIVDGSSNVTVTFSDGTVSPVEVVARLPDRDIAVLRAQLIEALHVARFADQDPQILKLLKLCREIVRHGVSSIEVYASPAGPALVASALWAVSRQYSMGPRR